MSDETAAEKAPEGKKAATGPQRRHRTTRHVAVHAAGTSGLAAASGVAHVFGPVGLVATAGGAVLVAGGTYAAKRAGKNRARTGRPAPRVRVRPSRDASGRRTGAGLRRDPSATRRTTTGRSTSKGRTATAARRRTPASKASATPRRAAGLRRGQVAGRSGTKGGRRVSTTTRRHRPAPVSPSRRSSAPRASKARKAPTARPGGSTPATRTARASATRTRARRAAATRPTPKHAARPATTKRPSTKAAATTARNRRTARIATRHATRAWRFAKTGAKASRPFLRLRPTPAEREALAKKNAKTAPASATTAKKAAPKKAAGTKPHIKPQLQRRPAAKPGPALLAPGQKREKVSDTHIPSGGITAVMDSIDTHIGGAEFENATEIFGFLAGLEGVCSHLGMALGNVADRLGSDYPIDRAVVEHIQEMAAFAVNLGGWGEQAHQLARAAHHGELQRIEQPRPNEAVFDVDHNR